MQIRKRSSQKLEEQQLIQNCSFSQLNSIFFNENLNKFNHLITSVLKSSRATSKKHFYIIWFAQECKDLKQKCLSKLMYIDDSYKTLKIKDLSKDEVQWHIFRPKRSLKLNNISTAILHLYYNNISTTDGNIAVKIH